MANPNIVNVATINGNVLSAAVNELASQSQIVTTAAACVSYRTACDCISSTSAAVTT